MKTSVSGLGGLIQQAMFSDAGLLETSAGKTLAPIIDDYVLGSVSSVNTGANPNYPLIATSVALNADPFNVFPFNAGTPAVPNPSATRSIYTDISDRVQAVDASFGRQYELDTISAGVATFDILDKDEAFNPSNTGSIYYPNVKIYRQIFDGAMWPPTPAGSAVNLLNLSAYYPVDPTMESYAVGTFPQPFIQISTATPSVTTSNPFAGSQCLSMSVTSGDTLDYIGWLVPCIPGQKYTSSVYVQTSYAFYLAISVYDGFNTGTDMNVSATYTRLSVTFTATKPLHIVMVATDGSSLASNGTINLDNFQHECGGVMNAFATTGPIIAGLFGGFVERWPATWNFHGTYGLTQITGTDAFAALTNNLLATELYTAILSTAPDYYWPLNDAAGATTFGEQSGHSASPLVTFASKYGAGSGVTAGTEMTIVGDPGATGVAFVSPALLPGQQNAGTIVSAGVLAKSGTFTLPATIGTSWSITAMAWVANAPTTPTSQSVVLVAGVPVVNAGGGGDLQFPVKFTLYTTGQAEAKFGCLDSGGTFHSVTAVSAATGYNDSLPHFLLATVTQVSGGNTSVSLYVDGAAVVTTTVTTASLGGMLTASANTIEIGGSFTRTTYDQMLNGPVSHAAIWNRALSAGEISNLYQVGANAYAGDTSGTRIARYLARKPFAFTDIETGTTTLSSSKITSGTPTLDAIQAISLSEFGNFFVDGFGTLNFHGRNHRFLELTPVAVFGENAAAGEIPYADDIGFDYDPTLVFNSVEVDQDGGTKDTAIDVSSQNSYGPRGTQVNTLTNTASEVTDYANWILLTHKQPSQRVSGITVNVAANPALWPKILALKFADRVTVKRRTPIFTMQFDCFIERIERSRGVDGTFTVTYQMSPVSTQPWILDDPTFSVLDSTTILGF